MKIQKAILLFATLIFSSSVFAAAGAPVKHNHNGRAHTHPLPAAGTNHNHNSGGSRVPQKQPTNNGWAFIASGKKGNSMIGFHGKLGSHKLHNNHFSIIGKVHDSIRNTVELYKWSVPIAGCRNQYGQIMWSQDGKNATFDFAFGSGNTGSAIAEAICNGTLR